jgi:hypothetical protein
MKSNVFLSHCSELFVKIGNDEFFINHSFLLLLHFPPLLPLRNIQRVPSFLLLLWHKEAMMPSRRELDTKEQAVQP